ncbi:MAG: 1,2-phenylacetyl-CoA epoxidase subunit B [Flavobacteriales bacterium]|nr:1,2-phenylacetyl-CoA epoxidase subunit B [Flavobacteriales bacterium]
MIHKSLDPRIDRANLSLDNTITPLAELDQLPTFEVFHQSKRGQQHVHVGIVHAPNHEMALMYAKEQYARRGETSNLWVVPSNQVMATEYLDSDIFETTNEKTYRDPGTYKVIDRINAYKERTKAN